MVNPEIINERLREMEENLILLEELKSTPAGKFRDDPKIFKLAERCLEVSIQALLDICHHIIAENGWPKPKDNQEAIAIMAKHKIMPKDFVETILPMAGLRNLLVHEYVKIDPALIYQHCQNLADFRTFQKYIVKFLNE
jgi:uncharacterized protein YutE (UPF0331/DUF86 family)